MFFYVNDIMFVYRKNRKQIDETYIDRLKEIFEMRDMKSMKFFLDVRVIHDLNVETIYSMQDIYIDKLIKNYQININFKASSISLSVRFITESYQEDVNLARMHEYRKKMRSVCYLAVISRLDIVKVVLKLTEHFINFKSTYLIAVNYLIKYLDETKHLTIKFDVSKNNDSKQVFEVTADAAFANEKERKSIK
jgi:hypothetical protein